MPPRLDLRGRRFGRWRVLRPAKPEKYSLRWHCICSCGVRRSVRAADLSSAQSRSCGCLKSEAGRRARLDLRGRRFGRWRVIAFYSIRDHRTVWRCVCECGTHRCVRGHDLISRKSKSCGCGRADHGQSYAPEYRIWIAMKARCENRKGEIGRASCRERV